MSERFLVSAESRHPRVGVDYRPDADPPHYTQGYLNPLTYAVTVDAFPGVVVDL